jgi:hypothetical protein
MITLKVIVNILLLNFWKQKNKIYLVTGKVWYFSKAWLLICSSFLNIEFLYPLNLSEVYTIKYLYFLSKILNLPAKVP